MDYNHAIARIGEVIDATGVAVIVVGLLISAGAAAVGLGHHETDTYRRSPAADYGGPGCDTGARPFR